MADFTADFEAGVLGNTVTTAAGEASATAWTFTGPGMTYSDTHVAHGSLSGEIDGTDNNATLWTIPSTTDHYGRMYFYATANPGGERNIIKFLAGGSTYGFVAVQSDGKLKLKDLGAAHSQASTVAIALNNWIRIEWHMIASATVGQLVVRLFNQMDSATPTETITPAANWNTGTQTTDVAFLDVDAAWGSSLWIDDVVANATDWPGPVVSYQKLFASADSVDGAWTDDTGGTSLAAAIDEATASDADYIRSELSPSASGCRVKLQAGGDPHLSTDHTINWRAGKLGSATINMTVKLYQGGGDSLGGGTLIASFDRNGVGSLTTYTETLSGGEADSITDYTDLYLEFFADTA